MSYNPFSLEGKKILITGASSGIGKGIAIECSKLGASLIVTGRDNIKLQDTLYSLEGDTHISITADLSNFEGVNKIVSSLSKLDGIVLAAGISELWPVIFASHDKFEKIYATNLFSPIELIRQILKKKIYNKPCSVVIIDSVAGDSDITPGNGVYGSGKAALKSYNKYLALEMAPKGIRFNTISPGMILTPMYTEGVLEEEALIKAVDKIPLKKWGKPEDVAYAVIYLLSDASSYVTGTDICIDGGMTI